jgi:hypothetical protein
MVQHCFDFILSEEYRFGGFFAKITLVGLSCYHLEHKYVLLDFFYIPIDVLQVADSGKSVVDIWVTFFFNLVKI